MEGFPNKVFFDVRDILHVIVKLIFYCFYQYILVHIFLFVLNISEIFEHILKLAFKKLA